MMESARTMPFPVFLSSNGTPTLYPNNRPCNFTNRFDEGISLDGDWEVALQAVKLPSFNLCITPAVCRCNLFIFRLVKNLMPDTRTPEKLRIILPVATYESWEELIDKCNEQIQQGLAGGDKIVLKYNHEEHKVYIESNVPACLFDAKPTARLARALGWDYGSTEGFLIANKCTGDWVIKDSTATCAPGWKLPPTHHPTLEIPELFVYTDIVHPQLVSHTRAPLLNILASKYNTTPRRRTLESYYIEHPLYVRVCQSQLDSIKIHIRNKYGEEIPLSDGAGHITLHFRPVITQL